MTQELKPGYVYHRKLVLPENLKTLITYVSQSPSYYFLRYSHCVSGICQKSPDKIEEIEGQVFNSICEMRWKKIKSGYEVLVLSKQELNLENFEQLTGKWKICDRNAVWYNPEEPRFPKGFIFKDENDESLNPKDIEIKQRYFQNADTATIHFVALTVK
ncbi:hypothetical protein WJM97_18255 [Okeanomitos corallinicola TIOX110]|uniref:Uncharacterized protein n=1 Tax=Okeanomitos corallinicola TIOX110 TaxID=3133117 RepID=A0ABZ2UPK7_9CYAN